MSLHFGLENPRGSQNCFLNSVVQMLWHLHGFRKRFTHQADSEDFGAHTHRPRNRDGRGGHYDNDDDDDDDEDRCFFCAFRDFWLCVTALDHTEANTPLLSTVELRLRLAMHYYGKDKFQYGDTADAGECLDAILVQLHKGLTRYRGSGGSSARSKGHSTALGYDVLHFEALEACAPPCLIHELFGIHVVEYTVCDAGHLGEPSPTIQGVLYVLGDDLLRHRPRSGGDAWPSDSAGSNNALRFEHAVRESADRRDDMCECGQSRKMQRCLLSPPRYLFIATTWVGVPHGDAFEDYLRMIPEHIVPGACFDDPPSGPYDPASMSTSFDSDGIGRRRGSHTVAGGDGGREEEKEEEEEEEDSNANHESKRGPWPRHDSAGSGGDEQDTSTPLALCSIVCFVSEHYVCFARHLLTTGQEAERWWLYDDAHIQQIGSYEAVQAAMGRNHYLPVLLGYSAAPRAAPPTRPPPTPAGERERLMRQHSQQQTAHHKPSASTSSLSSAASSSTTAVTSTAHQGSGSGSVGGSGVYGGLRLQVYQPTLRLSRERREQERQHFFRQQQQQQNTVSQQLAFPPQPHYHQRASHQHQHQHQHQQQGRETTTLPSYESLFGAQGASIGGAQSDHGVRSQHMPVSSSAHLASPRHDHHRQYNQHAPLQQWQHQHQHQHQQDQQQQLQHQHQHQRHQHPPAGVHPASPAHVFTPAHSAPHAHQPAHAPAMTTYPSAHQQRLQEPGPAAPLNPPHPQYHRQQQQQPHRDVHHHPQAGLRGGSHSHSHSHSANTGTAAVATGSYPAGNIGATNSAPALAGATHRAGGILAQTPSTSEMVAPQRRSSHPTHTHTHTHAHAVPHTAQQQAKEGPKDAGRQVFQGRVYPPTNSTFFTPLPVQPPQLQQQQQQQAYGGSSLARGAPRTATAATAPTAPPLASSSSSSSWTAVRGGVRNGNTSRASPELDHYTTPHGTTVRLPRHH
ncbi:hypothetical protein PTSG_12740 [Salpingoeca rosetta]|uniref:Peptidase C19 ubiquitin carboxyl-terminal hydrolase domain-containing protein n=1 Tax=Salpingoeca rosetta (strain ATCC 50818 / BSB-021) TaxID=946362 RepID=F2UJV6_SALR5|nr:uncharacterized protein PTSG_12740 [Salpingoeca rosetta]EGD77405.1 hypothetical protein PTSG_12740 [Salpingoeca rosetta]|eukprot:XP_004990749.1 hypothetical protein PTSG_12740 [Salpingoeca rosetta]